MNPETLKAQLQSLLASNPELADDETLKLDMIEGATDAHTVLRYLLEQIVDAKAMAKGISEYEKTFADRRHRLERKAESLRGLIFQIMQSAELKRLPLPIATLTVGQGQQKVIVSDESAIPDRFMKVEKTPRKTEIKAAISSGESVPGATLSNAEPVLTIRMN